jgi:hypothetical protein
VYSKECTDGNQVCLVLVCKALSLKSPAIDDWFSFVGQVVTLYRDILGYCNSGVVCGNLIFFSIASQNHGFPTVIVLMLRVQIHLNPFPSKFPYAFWCPPKFSCKLSVKVSPCCVVPHRWYTGSTLTQNI